VEVLYHPETRVIRSCRRDAVKTGGRAGLLERRPNVHKVERLAIVITHRGASERLVDVPWLEVGFQIDASDWINLSNEGWRAAAEGDAVLWDALERKLLIGFYVTQPDLIAVIGHPGGRDPADPDTEGQAQVRRIIDRVRSLLLPTAVFGFWTDEEGWLQDFVDIDNCGDGDCSDRARFWKQREHAAGHRT
jgi:hypothetical protein